MPPMVVTSTVIARKSQQNITYYLFQQQNLCGFYSKAAAIRERRLFNSMKTFCKYTCTKSKDVSTDGKEDNETHCLKEGGWLMTPKKQRKETRPLLEADDIDPFADTEEDKEELD